MMASYLLRLFCLSLASFFLVHLALGLAVLLSSSTALRLARRLHSNTASRILLALRLLPVTAALLLVLLVFIPGYLWLEPASTPEPIGLLCIAIAALGAAVWSISIARTLQAAARSSRLVRGWQRTGRPAFFRNHPIPVWKIDGPVPHVMLAGFIRSHLIVSSRVVDNLTAEQLSAVLKHEEFHSRSRDNLKRLLVMLSPGLVPFYRGFAILERGWANVVEWAADDSAVAGDSERSLALAAALVQVARMGIAPAPTPLTTSLTADGLDLSTRIDRLLHNASAPAAPARGGLLPAASAAVAAVLLALLLRPAILRTAYEILEELIR